MDVCLLTPTLRTLGNIFATAKPAEILPSFSARGPHHMQCLLAAASLPHSSLQKEALWVLSNFAALHTNERLSPQTSARLALVNKVAMFTKNRSLYVALSNYKQLSSISCD